MALFRLQFIRDYTLKTLRLKNDKWSKLWASDEQRQFVINFVEKGDLIFNLWSLSDLSQGFNQELVISQTTGGQILASLLNIYRWPIIILSKVHTDWPAYLLNKGVFFVKRENDGIPDLAGDNKKAQDLLDFVTCGDVHPNVLGRWLVCHSAL